VVVPWRGRGREGRRLWPSCAFLFRRALGFDSDGVFGHRSRLGPARNAEGGYGSLCSSSPRRDAGWLPHERRDASAVVSF